MSKPGQSIGAIGEIVKISQLLKVGVRTRRFAVACFGSSLKYGAGCLGASTAQMRRRRADMHSTVTRRTAGRSATLDMAITRGNHWTLDVGYFLSAAPIRDLAAALWESWVPRAWILRSWIPAFREAFLPTFHWNQVTDPIAAAAASCARIGWSADSPGVLRDQG